jgi:hypothetical protein
MPRGAGHVNLREGHQFDDPHLDDPLCHQLCSNSLHRRLVILGREQVPIPIHRNLKAAVTSICLNRFRLKPLLYPRRYGEVAEAVPANP